MRVRLTFGPKWVPDVGTTHREIVVDLRGINSTNLHDILQTIAQGFGAWEEVAKAKLEVAKLRRAR